MTQSMPGFAAASAETPRGRLSVELRSVNARFLDLQFRIADDLRALEPALRELVTARVSRGKLDCRVYLNDAAAPAASELNPQALAQLRELAARVQKEMPQATPLRVADVLRWPGVMAQAPFDEAETRGLATELMRRALEGLVGSRPREGAQLAAPRAPSAPALPARVDAIAPPVAPSR